MNKDILIQIYNALGTISTKGQDTITMADCLRAMLELINQKEE